MTIILSCSITDDVHLGHLLKMLPTRILLFTIIFLVISTFWKSTLKLCKTFIPYQMFYLFKSISVWAHGFLLYQICNNPSITLFIYDAQVIPDMASRSPFNLASVSF